MATHPDTSDGKSLDVIDDDRLMDHEYDGIREYDNPTPGWWHLIFFACIFFSFFYWAAATFTKNWTVHNRYDKAVAAYLESTLGEISGMQPTEENLLMLMNSTELARAEPDKHRDWLAVGRSIFISKCANCHAEDGGGKNGPNLTDDHYINVKKITDIYGTIHDGVVQKGMPQWSKQLLPEQILLVTAYAASLRGTTPAAPNPPDGDVIPQWPEYQPAD